MAVLVTAIHVFSCHEEMKKNVDARNKSNKSGMTSHTNRR
jgi:hypothetical protein